MGYEDTKAEDCTHVRIGLVKYYISSAVVYTGPDTIITSEEYLGVREKGTHLAMPNTICVPNSLSLKPGSGATEGVLD